MDQRELGKDGTRRMYNHSAGGLLLPSSPSNEKRGRGGGEKKGRGRVKGRKRKGEKKKSE